MMARKLYNFPDVNLDRQIVELVNGINKLAGMSGGLTDVNLSPVVGVVEFGTFAKVYELPAGETSAERIVDCDSNKFVCASEGSAKIFTSEDGGANWTYRAALGTEVSVYGMVYLESGIILAGTHPNGKLWRSTNHGFTWAEITSGYSDAGKTDLRGFAYLGNGIALIGNTNSSALGQSGKIWRSTDYGLNWTQVYNGSLTADYYYITSITHAGDAVVLALATPAGLGSKTDSKVLRSVDAGITWSVATTLQATATLTIASNGTGVSLVACSGVGTSAKSIYKTADYGATWSDLGQRIPGVSIHNGLIYIADGTWLVGTNGSGDANCSAWITADDGATWALLQNLVDVPGDVTVYTFAKSGDTVIAGTYNITGGVGKIWKMPLGSTARAIGAYLRWDGTYWVDDLV